MRAKNPPRSVKKRQSTDLFKTAQQVASENRDLQGRVLTLVREMIGQAKRGDNDSYNKSIDNFNAAKDSYNSNVRKLDELQRKIARE